MYKNVFKPFFDFIAALLCLLVFSPIFIIVYLSLAYVNKGNPFFFQTRPGKNGKLFNIIKFKTMTEDKDKNGVLLPDVDRLTNLGKFVRKTSLDELPQLINVIKGDMSIIGPRPLLPHYLELYTDEQKKRHLVRPGITGLSQVKGRNLMKFSQRFINDTWYVENLTFVLDIKIVFLTIKKIISSEGIVSGQDVTDVDDLGFNK
ncbi:sugar transferase [Olleya aquimaris]|uniref:Sugar transferase n=1 Tax=Olleya sediminilitoris TaxID=2795739 RepID=A0ABS1WHC4_9FLAO|nr:MULTISPECIES: sugar transferase [Olleya]AXO81859.1 sugar transferase [Olleya aquimaris]MBL7558516.1 sugar transferase [Olleya sediminilitoris]